MISLLKLGIPYPSVISCSDKDGLGHFSRPTGNSGQKMIPIKACEKDGDKMCASFELHQKQFSFAEVNSEAEKIGAALLSLGLKPGDNIAIWGPNQPEESFEEYFRIYFKEF